MSKVEKAVCVLMIILMVLFLVCAVFDFVEGDSVSVRLNLAWCVICIMQCRIGMLSGTVRDQHETIGKMIELLGLMVWGMKNGKRTEDVHEVQG